MTVVIAMAATTKSWRRKSRFLTAQRAAPESHPESHSRTGVSVVPTMYVAALIASTNA